MPNNPLPPIDEKSYIDKVKLAKKSLVEVVLYAGVGPATKPFESSAPIHRLTVSMPINGQTTGPVPYKVFMGPSIGDLFFHSQTKLEDVIKNYQGCAVSFHCEDPEILDANKNQATHELKRPPEAEVFAIDFAISLIEKYQLQGKICHCSTKAGIEKIRQAKKRGIKVTAEVSPHHLYFDASIITDKNHNLMQMNPPLRNHDDRNALVEGLKNGTLDYLATDHAPHTLEEKNRGISGTPQLDTYGPFVTWLIKECGFTTSDIARICSYNPGNWFSQFSQVKYGEIKAGFAGSLTIIDMKKPIIISKSMLKTKCGWSGFEGVRFPGRVVYTIIKGKAYKGSF